LKNNVVSPKTTVRSPLSQSLCQQGGSLQHLLREAVLDHPFKIPFHYLQKHLIKNKNKTQQKER